MELIRILYVNGGIMHRGGIESYMMNYYRHIDRTKIQIDFIVHGFEKGVYDDEIKRLGGRIFNVPVKSKSYLGNIRALKKIFMSGQYKIIHSHMDAMSMVVLKTAQECGIPIRIAHSHNTQHLTNNRIKYYINEYAKKNITKYATHCFACSELAGRWLFGDENVDKNRVTFIKNAIELDKYKFNLNERKKIRKEFEVEDSFVIGHVGRFDYQKNHLFLLGIFSELLKEQPNSKLLLVGDGHLRKEIESKIEALNIKDNVILAGARNDVQSIFNGLDVFCLPSLFEGMPVVSVEAQCNGLSCLFSDTITREAQIDKNVEYLKLEASSKFWTDSLLSASANALKRTINPEKFINKGYSISNEVINLQNIYLSLYRESNNVE